LLATGASDGTARLWEVESGKEIRVFIGHTAEIMEVEIFAEGKKLITGSRDGTVRIWDTHTGEEILRFLEHKKKEDISDVTAVAVSPNGSMALSGGYGSVARLWEINTGRELKNFPAKKGIYALAFWDDGQKIAIGDGSGAIHTWNLEPKKEIITIQAYENAAVASLAFSPDGKQLVCGGGEKYEGNEQSDFSPKIFEVESGAQSFQFKGDGFGDVHSVGFRKDGSHFFAVDTLFYRLWRQDKNNWKLLRNGFSEIQISAALVKPGDLSLIVHMSDVTILTDPQWKKPRRVFKGEVSQTNSLSISNDGGKILLGGDKAYLWDMNQGREILRVGTETAFNNTQLSPDGTRIVTDNQSAVTVWDVTSGRELKSFSGHKCYINSVAYSPDQNYIISGGGSNWDTGCQKDCMLRFWESRTGTEVNRLDVFEQDVKNVVWSNNGKYILAIGNLSGKAFLWGFEKGKITGPILELDFVSAAGFSPGDIYLITGYVKDYYEDHRVTIWDIRKREHIKNIAGLSKDADVTAVAFTPVEDYVLVGGEDGSLRLINWREGNETVRYSHPSPVTSVVSLTNEELFKKGEFFVTGCGDGAYRVWETFTGRNICTFASFRNGHWVVTDAVGRFDTDDLEKVQGIHWMMPDDPLKPLSIEIFMRDYYEPKLLPRLLAGEEFPVLPSVAELYRVQPEVKIIEIIQDPMNPGRVSVMVEVGKASGEYGQGKDGKKQNEEVFDLRLFRERQLVGYRPEANGEIKIAPDQKKTRITFGNVKIPRKENINEVVFSAYAFNFDRVKSKTHFKTFKIPAGLVPVKGNAYVVTVGVNAYENSEWNLKYAARDAKIIEKTLVEKLQQTGQFENIVAISLISDYKMELGNRVVTENNATKQNFKAVLDFLAGKKVDTDIIKAIPRAGRLREANPEDLLFISFSSHGDTDRQGNFYFFPYDIGKDSHKKTPKENFLNRCISSDELSLWLRDVDAGEMVMVVDACHSAATVEKEGFKPGPMGSRGLGQLAYNKGMKILAASQADNVAQESSKIRQGLLTYALVHDGIDAVGADFEPEDNSITLSEWLQYGVKRVPVLCRKVLTQLPHFRD
jgi:WD40 repeat protein